MAYQRPQIFQNDEWILVGGGSGDGTGVNGDMQSLLAVDGSDIQYGAAISGDFGYGAFIRGYQADPAPHYESGVLVATPYNRFDDTQNTRSITSLNGDGTPEVVVYFNPYRNEWTGEQDAVFAPGLAYLIAGVNGAGAWELEVFRRVPIVVPPVPPDPTADPCPRPDWPYASGLNAGPGDWGSVRFRTYH